MEEQSMSQRSSSSNHNVVHTDNSCVICLDSNIRDPTILSTCQHYFCYDCIQTWMLTNPCCPMCKKALCFIKHDLVPKPLSLPMKYDSVSGTQQNVEDILSAYEFGFVRNLGSSSMELELHSTDLVISELYDKQQRQRELFASGDLTNTEFEQRRSDIANVIRKYTTLRLKIETAGKTMRAEVYNTPEFRRIVYRCNLAPRSRLAPKFPLEPTPVNIRTNECAIRCRLYPYLIREFAALVNRDAIDIDRHIDIIMSYLKDVAKGPNALENIHRLGIAHPQHFVNNLLHFVSSGQRLHVYDENSEYYTRGNGDLRSYLLPDNDIEVLDDINNSRSHRIGFTSRWGEFGLPSSLTSRRHRSVDDDDVIMLAETNARNRRRNQISPIVLDDEPPRQMITLSDDDGDTEDQLLYTHPQCLLPRNSGPPRQPPSRSFLRDMYNMDMPRNLSDRRYVDTIQEMRRKISCRSRQSRLNSPSSPTGTTSTLQSLNRPQTDNVRDPPGPSSSSTVPVHENLLTSNMNVRNFDAPERTNITDTDVEVLPSSSQAKRPRLTFDLH